MSIKRAVEDIQIYRGDTPTHWYQIMEVNDETDEETPLDINRHTITAQVRYSPESIDTWFTLPIEKVDPDKGIFQWRLTKAQSEELLPVGSGLPNTAVYDMQIEIEGSVFTFMVGKFSVTYDITR